MATEQPKLGARGEALLELDGEAYPILYTNRALAQAEKAIGKPMLQLLSRLETSTLSIADTAQLLAIGMEFGRRDAKSGPRMLTIDDAWRVMDALGFTTVLTAVLGAVADVLSFSRESIEGDADRPPE